MFNKLKASKPTLIYALGGLDEVGKNVYVVEHKNEIVIMDCGQRFSSSLPGVNAIIPDFSYLIKNKKKIKAIIATHGHEDHIGSIPYLISQISIPIIYAPKIGIALIKKKLKEFNQTKCPKLIEYDGETTIKTKHFIISMFLVNHSIPQSYGVAITTPNGLVVNTGDYKFDFTPVGENCNIKKMEELGNKGIDLLLADSTNSEIPGFTPSESLVRKEIDHILHKAKGRVIIATFASNIDRIAHIVQTARKHERKIAVFGRSMAKVIDIGKEIGLIEKPQNLFIKKNDIANLEDKKILILCTGSQGEQMAALSRIACNKHNHIKIKPRDTVVFSSSPIPGNTLNIIRLVNSLSRLGAQVKVNRENGILHTSGHANQGEQTLMFELTKPHNFMPVHGEYRMQVEHGYTAIKSGVKKNQVFVVNNGETLQLVNGQVSRGDKVASGVFYIDQNNQKMSEQDYKNRTKMSDNGLICIFIPINKYQNKIITSPKIISKGFILIKENTELVRKIQQTANHIIKKHLQRGRIKLNPLEKEIGRTISRFIGSRLKRFPLIKTILVKNKI